MTPVPTADRVPTDVDRLADRYVERVTALDPVTATFLGAPGREDAFPDYSPHGHAAMSELRRATLAELGTAVAVDVTDRITVAAMREDLQTAEDLHELGDDERDLNILASAQEDVRLVFDLMPTATDDDWATIARRMAAIPAALDGFAASLRHAAALGRAPARRQVAEVATRMAANIGTDGFFFGLIAGADDPTAGGPAAAGVGPTGRSGAVLADLRHGAQLASGAYAQFQDFLRRELLPLATGRDAYGRERYAVHLRRHLGAQVDLDETYAWG